MLWAIPLFSIIKTIGIFHFEQILNVSYTQSIDITNGPQTVTISGDFTDVNEYRTSELERVYFVLRGNTGSGNIDIDQCDLFPSSGVTSISHSCTFTVPDTFPSQTMELRAYAKDAASNELNANVGGVAVTNNGWELFRFSYSKYQ